MNIGSKSILVGFLFAIASVACDVDLDRNTDSPTDNLPRAQVQEQNSVLKSDEKSNSGKPVRSIAVAGKSKKLVEPDIAIIRIGIEVFDLSVSQARSRSTGLMESVIKGVVSEGVESNDIQTGRYDISPRYEYQEDMKQGRTVGKQVLTGYVINNVLHVKISDLENIGKVVDRASTIGGDDVRINGIEFNIDDREPFLNDLRERAVSDAISKAGHYAELSGVSLGPIISLSERGVDQGRDSQVVGYEMRAMAIPKATPILSGELEISLSINVVFSIR